MSNHSFNPASVLQNINQLEEIFPVHDWQIDDVKIWPFLRTAIAYSQNQNPNTKVQAGKKKSEHRNLWQYARIMVNLPFEYYRLRRLLKKSNRLFAGASTHRILIDGVFINKYFDLAVQDFAANKEFSFILDNKKRFAGKKYLNREFLFSLPSLYLLAEISSRFKFINRNHQVNLERYDEFHQHLLNHFEHTGPLKKHFGKSAVTKRLMSLIARKEFWKKHLRTSKIETAYVLCYYSSTLYPLIAACNELGIKTVDIQHGGIGAGHYAYDRWQPLQQGYSLLPRYFWTWDKHTALLINRWADKTGYHKAISNSNPWTEDCLRVYTAPPEFKDYILFNMTEVFLEDFVVDAIRHFGDRYKWVLRMHPRQYQNKALLEAQIKEKHIQEHVSVENSNQVPLFFSLKYCRMFLSKASGSVIEAVELGMKPLLLRSQSTNYYAHYIEEKRVSLLQEDTGPFLIKFIEDNDERNDIATVNLEKGSRNKFDTFEKLLTL